MAMQSNSGTNEKTVKLEFVSIQLVRAILYTWDLTKGHCSHFKISIASHFSLQKFH